VCFSLPLKQVIVRGAGGRRKRGKTPSRPRAFLLGRSANPVETPGIPKEALRLLASVDL